jgi:hypothetical protein
MAYTRRQKVTAVLAADMTNPKAASEATGIPRTTILAWLDKEEFVSLRQNARDAIAEEAIVVARLAWQALGDAILARKVEPRDLIHAAGMATEKALLASGEATARTEHRDISDPDAAGIDALEQILTSRSAWAVSPGLEPGRNGTGTNGKH